MAAQESDIELSGNWLAESSDEFQEIKDYVTICVRGRTVSEIEVFKVENSALLLKFQKSYANFLTLQCWYDVRGDNASENGVIDICKNGFISTMKAGLEFNNGLLSDAMVDRHPNVNVIILADVAVGRSFVCDQDSVNKGECQLPEGFDSFYVVDKPLDRDGDGEFSLQEFQAAAHFDGRFPGDYSHKYFIKDSAQAYPKYFIRFVINESDSESGMVGASISTFDAEFVEGANAVLIDSLSFNPISYQERNSQNGRNQRYLTIDEAMNKAIEKFNDRDAITEHKKNWLDGQLDLLDEKARQITLNYADVLESVEGLSEKALKKLQAMIKKKLNHALSLEMELRRQLEQYLWLELSFGKHMRNLMSSLKDSTMPDKVKMVKKLEFLRSWRNYTNRQSELSRSRATDIQVFHSIKPDLKLEGDLFVISQADIGGMSDSTILGSSINSLSLSEGKKGFASSSYLNSSFGKYISTTRSNSDKDFQSSVHEVALSQVDRLKETIGMATCDSTIPFPRSLQGNETFLVSRGTSNIDPTTVFKDAILQMTRDKIRSTKPTAPQSSSNMFMNANNTFPEPSEYDEDDDEVDDDETKSDVSSISNSPSVKNEPQQQQQQREYKPASPEAYMWRGFTDTAPAKRRVSADFSPDDADFFDTLSTQYKQFSLSELGNKKIKQMQTRNVSNLDSSLASLHRSNILTVEEAKTIFFNIPFFSAPPALRLVYSSVTHRKSLDELYSKAASHKGPCLMFIESKQSKFGAYFSHPLSLTGNWSGSAACFLFSLTWDMKFPYHGRNAISSYGLVSFFASRESLKVGQGDLVISADLSVGSSALENCFGLGVTGANRDRIVNLLGGRLEFPIDKVELWSVSPGK